MGEEIVVDDADRDSASLIRASDILYTIIRSSAVYLHIILI